MENKPLLSICIPTYNRAAILQVTLRLLVTQIADLKDKGLISLYISDNASTDETKTVIQGFIEEGAPIEYSRNEINIGPDRNFLKCFQTAKGKYIWLLGDDDPVCEGAILKIVDVLQSEDLGLLHISPSHSENFGYKIYHDVNDFLCQVSYWITFISANIFRAEDVIKVKADEELLHSNMMQVPFFLSSASSHDKNAIIYDKLLDTHLYDDNGGFNFFKVFVDNQFKLWQKFVENGSVTNECFNYVKKDICKKFIGFYIAELLFLRRQLATKNKKEGRKGGYYIDDAWRILFKYYGKNAYFYAYLLNALEVTIMRVIKRIIRILFK